ncbi:MAG: hypothetical protein WAX14_20745, partial [Rhodococcus sp. (in: high G+C Gram-positive bacteria)]|uniref:hypothetical protein n=1 Tax=Rhodococcus sp. TaxID=1831 RepID=UPI003BB5D1C7
AADGLRAALSAPGAEESIEPGWAVDSAWRGSLPPEDGYVHIDDVPARVLVDLAQRGVAVTREQGAQGPPVSLLAQEVLEVTGGGTTVGVPMRLVFALNGMGFVPTGPGVGATADIDLARIDPAEVVRVRATSTWLRLDARYGSVYLRRGDVPGLNML